MRKGFLLRGFAMFALLGVVVFMIGCGPKTAVPSEQERQAEFDRWFAEKQATPQPTQQPTPQPKEEPQVADADIQKILNRIVFDDKHESPSLVLKIAGVDAFDFVVNTQPAREISVEITVKESLDRIMEVLEVKRQEDLPSFVKVLPDNTVLFPGQLIDLDPPPTIGLLTKDYVITHGGSYRDFCFGIGSGKMENVLAKYSVLPASGEAQWKEEVLFDGTANGFCVASEGYPKYYPENNVLVLKRPAIKLFPVPGEGAIKIGRIADLKPGGLLVLPVLSGDGLKAIYGILIDVATVPGTPIASINFFGLPESAPGSGDEGAPVYYISGDEEAPLKLVGFITGGKHTIATAMPAEYYLKGIEEISYEKK